MLRPRGDRTPGRDVVLGGGYRRDRGAVAVGQVEDAGGYLGPGLHRAGCVSSSRFEQNVH